MFDNRKAIATLAMLCLLAISCAEAEPTPAALTVDQAVAAALRNNLSIKSAELVASAKKRASDFSFNYFYPTISASVTAMRLNTASPELLGDKYQQATNLGSGDVLPNSSTYYYAIDQNNLVLGLTIQEVFSAGYILKMNKAVLDYQSSALDKTKAEKRMKASVKETFYQLLVQNEAIALTRARLNNANEQMRQAKISFDIGKGNELDYRNAKANAEGLIPNLRSMETARKTALAHFQDSLGFDLRPDMELAGSLDDEKIASADNAKLDGKSLDVLSAELSVKQLKDALKLQDSSLLPSLVLQYTADPALNGPSSWSKVLDSDNWAQSSGALSLTLAWNLSSFILGSDYSVKRKDIREQLDLAKDKERGARSSAAIDEANQMQAIEDSFSKIEDLREIVEDVKRAYDLTSIAYKAGTVRYLDLQNAEINLQSSQIQLLNERFNLLKLQCDLEAKYTD